MLNKFENQDFGNFGGKTNVGSSLNRNQQLQRPGGRFFIIIITIIITIIMIIIGTMTIIIIVITIVIITGQSVAVEEFAVQDQDSTLAQLQEGFFKIEFSFGRPP